MGRCSYWIDGLESTRTADDAARMLDAEAFGISIDHREDVWAVCDRGRPQSCRGTRAGADEIANRPDPIQWSVERFQSMRQVCTGHQHIFTTPDRSEAEGFMFGMAAHMQFRDQSDRST